MPPGTFAELWSARIASTPGQMFLLFQDSDGSVTRWTYGEFDVAVRRCQAQLAAVGVRRGDAVHVALRNCPAFVALWLACAAQGACLVPVDPSSSERDLVQQLNRVRPRVGFCGTGRALTYRAAAAPVGLTYIALAESASDLEQLGAPLAPPRIEVAEGDRLAVMFTSGTTSQPKGAVVTQANYREVAQVMSKIVGLGAAHRWYVTLPLFHANAQYYCFAPAIAAGASVALTSRFSASGWVRGARELEVTHASLFAAPIRMILARTDEAERHLALEHVWFAQSLGRVHFERFAELVGVPPRQLYGMTETLAIVCADQDAVPQPELIGRPAGGRHVRLVDPTTGRAPAVGAPGEIRVAGVRGRSLFLEYLDAPEATARAFEVDDAGVTWLRTGDLAADVGDGVLRFVGRADDVIKVAGENVSLTEVEAVVAQAPGVLEAAVLSKPDPVRDAVPVAYVVPVDPAAPPSTRDLEAWSRDNLSPAARPREWHVIDALPRTSVGKVRRFMIDPSLPDG
ncbi:class I adenylate-forming enzyme family protein [Dactylosporangium sucinum]|uniref:ATP-dependent acyl-CoA ligase n=1 Tax=Dactylosporangium sucinum TaxID=1424081 RepID=A0A917UBL1_9ACTN|nr:AMP-binding protein [Dactylosporangium sucinum]GGM69488.1 ATP-dependent acyl-CoA ligase [Dactylosporangium sucinum]